MYHIIYRAGYFYLFCQPLSLARSYFSANFSFFCVNNYIDNVATSTTLVKINVSAIFMKVARFWNILAVRYLMYCGTPPVFSPRILQGMTTGYGWGVACDHIKALSISSSKKNLH